MKRSAVHKDLRTPKYKMRVVALKTLYKRKPKNHKDNFYHDFIEPDSRRIYLQS
jgi:hypothetical protein